MSKRGLSQVVTTVIIILLVLSSIAIIWAFVRPTIEQTSSQIGVGTEGLTTRLELASVSVDQALDTADLSITRGAGGADFDRVRVVLTDDVGNSAVFDVDVTIQELETKSLAQVDFSSESLGNIVEVAIVPIFRDSDGSERLGRISDTEMVSSSGGSTATCSDTIMNQDETDVDCGGATCSACSTGQTCLVGGDCSSGYCGIGGTCQEPIPSNYVAYWRFNGGASDYSDETGNHDGTAGAGGAPISNNRLELTNQIDEWVDVAQDSDFDMGLGSFSYSAWIQIIGTTGPNLGQSSLSSNAFWSIDQVDTGMALVRCRVRDDAGVAVDGASQNLGPAPTSAMSLVTCVLDRNSGTYGELKTYLDGALVDTQALDLGTGGVIVLGNVSSGANDFRIGESSGTGSGSQGVNSNIDDVVIYDRALNSTEVTTLYNTQATENSY